MEFNLVCNYTSDWQNRRTAKQDSDLSIIGMITDRTGRHKALLTINHNRYNSWKQQIHFGQTSTVKTIPKVKHSSILEIPQGFFFRISGFVVVIVISSVIGGFGWKVWLASLTARLQVSNHSQRSDSNCTEWFVKNKVGNALITFDEIVMVMINWRIHSLSPTFHCQSACRKGAHSIPISSWLASLSKPFKRENGQLF